jgi:hypothetical protein
MPTASATQRDRNRGRVRRAPAALLRETLGAAISGATRSPVTAYRSSSTSAMRPPVAVPSEGEQGRRPGTAFPPPRARGHRRRRPGSVSARGRRDRLPGQARRKPHDPCSARNRRRSQIGERSGVFSCARKTGWTDEPTPRDHHRAPGMEGHAGTDLSWELPGTITSGTRTRVGSRGKSPPVGPVRRTPSLPQSACDAGRVGQLGVVRQAFVTLLRWRVYPVND